MQDAMAVGANRNTLFDFLEDSFVCALRHKLVDVSLWRRPVNVVKVNDCLMLNATPLAMK
jgi:hypothetical protein